MLQDRYLVNKFVCKSCLDIKLFPLHSWGTEGKPEAHFGKNHRRKPLDLHRKQLLVGIAQHLRIRLMRNEQARSMDNRPQWHNCRH